MKGLSDDWNVYFRIQRPEFNRKQRHEMVHPRDLRSPEELKSRLYSALPQVYLNFGEFKILHHQLSVMTSQNWIYDPPPPPPKKAAPENTKTYNSQRPVNGRDRFRGNPRQQQYSGNGRSNYNRQTNGQQGNRPRFMQPSPVSPQTGYQQPGQVPTFQPQLFGYAPQFPHPYPLQQHAFPIQQQYYPPQQYPQQFVPPGPLLQSRPLPVYQNQNNYGYTLSSTAFSLPDHHSQPQPSERPDLSEEELRYALEQQASKPRYSLIRCTMTYVVFRLRGRISG